MFKSADVIENRVAAAAVRADKLTQTILAKAFRGELVPTEAELARREGRSYESASVRDKVFHSFDRFGSSCPGDLSVSSTSQTVSISNEAAPLFPY